jgi:hypothetical protein
VRERLLPWIFLQVRLPFGSAFYQLAAAGPPIMALDLREARLGFDKVQPIFRTRVSECSSQGSLYQPCQLCAAGA